MKLLNFKDYSVTITPEALSIKCFKELWNRDRSLSKEKVMAELGFIYFFIDPRSTYMYLTDTEERADLIKEHLGLPKKWKPDEKVTKAMEVYSKLIHTNTSLMVEDLRLFSEKIRTYIRDLDIKEALGDGDNKLTLANLVKAVADLPAVAEKLAIAEKKASTELEERAKLRADKAASIGDRGLSRLVKKKGE